MIMEDTGLLMRELDDIHSWACKRLEGGFHGIIHFVPNEAVESVAMHRVDRLVITRCVPENVISWIFPLQY